VRLRDLDIEFIPEGTVLVLSYADRPGMVGRIGSILGQHHINIASMHVGRRARGGPAIVVLLVDDDVPPAVLDEVRASVRADFARIVRLGPAGDRR
jgi:D-3-phosphoglycerate dehydrogenase